MIIYIKSKKILKLKSWINQIMLEKNNNNSKHNYNNKLIMIKIF